MNKRKRFNKICKDIKEVKIQGATNVAKAGLKAYFLFPKSKKRLLKLRPTEPMLEKVLDLVEKKAYKEIMKHFDEAQNKINKKVFRLIKNKDVILTHCHSATVVKALIYSRKKGKKFEVYNTETRPLYQGRKIARELKKAGVKVTMFVDSAVGVALSKEQGTKKVTKVFLGADAITKKGIVNKIGSEVIAKLAKQEKIPVYILADSWKFTKKKIQLEKRSFKEVWNKFREIENPAFEFVPRKLIKKVINEK